MEQLLNLIDDISTSEELNEVITAVKKKQKEIKAELTLNALRSFNVGDRVLCESRDGTQEAIIEKINKTTADISIDGRKYNAPLSILKSMEVA